jgi:hypothetical protein
MPLRVVTLLPFAYCELRAFFKAVYDDGFADFKASVFILCAQGFLVMIALGVASIAAGRKLLPRSTGGTILMAVLLFLGLEALNHFTLLTKEKVSAYEKEFSSYSTHNRVLGSVLVLAVMLIIVAGVFVIGGVVRRLPG